MFYTIQQKYFQNCLGYLSLLYPLSYFSFDSQRFTCIEVSASIVADYGDKLGHHQGFAEVKKDVGAIYEKLCIHFQLH